MILREKSVPALNLEKKLSLMLRHWQAGTGHLIETEGRKEIGHLQEKEISLVQMQDMVG